MNIIEITFLVLIGSCLAACSYYYDHYCKENEWLRKCRSIGRDEYPCPGARVEACHFYLHNAYSRRVCTCYPGRLRSKSGKCVDPSDCEPEKPLSQEQLNLMERARQFLNQTDDLVLYYGVNWRTRRPTDVCWKSTKDVVLKGAFHHNIAYYETKGQPNNEHPRPYTERFRNATWTVKMKWQTPAINIKSYDGNKIDSSMSGTYVLFDANETCLVMGTVKNQMGEIYKKVATKAVTGQLGDSACFYWMKYSSSKESRQRCEDAFFKMCSSISGSWYIHNSLKCQTFRKSE